MDHRLIGMMETVVVLTELMPTGTLAIILTAQPQILTKELANQLELILTTDGTENHKAILRAYTT